MSRALHGFTRYTEWGEFGQQLVLNGIRHYVSSISICRYRFSHAGSKLVSYLVCLALLISSVGLLVIVRLNKGRSGEHASDGISSSSERVWVEPPVFASYM